MRDEHPQVVEEEKPALDHDRDPVAFHPVPPAVSADAIQRGAGRDVQDVEAVVDRVGLERASIQLASIVSGFELLELAVGDQPDDPQRQVDRVPRRVHLVDRLLDPFGGQQPRDSPGDVHGGEPRQQGHAPQLGAAVVRGVPLQVRLGRYRRGGVGSGTTERESNDGGQQHRESGVARVT